MTEDRWTPAESLDAFRTATSMILAAAREDPAAVAMLWNDAPAKDALVWALARVPVSLLHATAAARGAQLDLDRLLGDLLAGLAVMEEPPIDQGDDGDDHRDD